MNTIGLTTSTADRKRRAGQRMVIGIAGTGLSQEERRWIKELQPGGFVLFGRNIEDGAQLRDLNRELVSLVATDTPAIRCVDQEGGRVQRVKGTEWPPMRWVGNANDERLTAALGRAMARELRAAGFDLNFAPVVDVDSNPKNPVIGDRAFSPRPDRVARHALAYMRGMHDEGVATCIKHFPGHGDTSVDSHLDLPVVEKDPPDLDQVELAPFVACVAAGVPTVMTAHVLYPGWDERVPATMSRPIVHGILRERLGFQGVVFSDDMEMKAVRGRYTLEEQLLASSNATVDVYLFCKEIELQVQAYELLVRFQEDDKRQEDLAIDAVKRWNHLRDRFLKTRPPQPELDEIGSVVYRDIAMKVRARGQA